MTDPISVAKIQESWQRSYGRCFAPWSRMTPEEWAEETYRLPNGRRFKWSYCPHSLGMFRSIFDKTVIETIFQLYSRGFKSTVVLLAIGFLIDQMPRRILNLWPTNSQAEKFSKDNLCGELFDTTPCLNYLGTKGNRRMASNTILHKTFPGGLMDMFGANAPGDMRRAKGSFLYTEEIDAIKEEETDEGDQLAIFSKRGDEYPDTIRVSASYPALQNLDEHGNPKKGHSRINTKLRRSDENHWQSTCVRCGGEPFVMLTSMIHAEEGKAHTARMECPRCGEFLTDPERYQMAHGQGFENWKPTREFRGYRGFQGNAMLWPHPHDPLKCPGGALQMIAQERMNAESSGDRARNMRTFVNMVDAEPFDASEENERPPEWKPLFARREDYDLIVPHGGLFLTAFCDCQKNRLEVGWEAYGRGEESWVMEQVVIEGYVGHKEVWKELRKQFAREWTHASGAKMRLGFGFVDGGAYAEDVYRFFQGLAQNPEPHVTGHVQASKGVGAHPHPIVTHGKMSTIAKALKGRYIGTWQAKDRIYERLRMTIEDGKIPEGYTHFNKRLTEEYFQGMTIETATQKIDGDQIYNTYKDEVTGNEPLDCRVGCLAALRLYPRNWDALEANIKADAESRKPDAVKPKEAVTIFSGGGWRL